MTRVASVVALFSLFWLAAVAPAASLGPLHIFEGNPAREFIELKKVRGYWQIEHCPDNTCEVLRLKSVASVKDDFARFYYGYLFYIDDYAYLSRWRKERGSESSARAALMKISNNPCNQKRSDFSICTLLWYAKKNKIEGEFVRFDEGHETVVEFSLTEKIAGRSSGE